VPVGIRSKALDLTKGISQRLLVQVRIGLQAFDFSKGTAERGRGYAM
jgi:hypothetical protein